MIWRKKKEWGRDAEKEKLPMKDGEVRNGKGETDRGEFDCANQRRWGMFVT